MNALKRKMKFLATKLSALQSEVVVSREIFHAASADVKKMFDQKYFPEIPVEQEKTEEDQPIKEYSEEEAEEQQEKQQEEKVFTAEDDAHPDQSTAEKNASPEVRKMFRKIATQCHPDKLGRLDDGFEKKKKEELYNKARQALENDDILIMADVASALGVEVPEISEVQLKQTEQKIIAIKNELHQIESTLVWHWFFTEDPQAKEDILKRLFEFMYENHPRP